MAFDVGHRPYQPQPLLQEQKTLEDYLDLVLRIIVLAPLLGALRLVGAHDPARFRLRTHRPLGQLIGVNLV